MKNFLKKHWLIAILLACFVFSNIKLIVSLNEVDSPIKIKILTEINQKMEEPRIELGTYFFNRDHYNIFIYDNKNPDNVVEEYFSVVKKIEMLPKSSLKGRYQTKHFGDLFFVNINLVKSNEDDVIGIEEYNSYDYGWKVIPIEIALDARKEDKNLPLTEFRWLEITNKPFEFDMEDGKEMVTPVLIIKGGVDYKTGKPINTKTAIDINRKKIIKTEPLNQKDIEELNSKKTPDDIPVKSMGKNYPKLYIKGDRTTLIEQEINGSRKEIKLPNEYKGYKILNVSPRKSFLENEYVVILQKEKDTVFLIYKNLLWKRFKKTEKYLTNEIKKINLEEFFKSTVELKGVKEYHVIGVFDNKLIEIEIN